MSITRAGNVYSIFEGPNQDHVENTEITRADTKTIILKHIGKNPGIRYRSC